MAEIQLQFSVAMAPVIRFQQNHRHQQLRRDISEKWAHLKLKSQCCNYHAQQSISEVRRYVSLWGVNVCLAISPPLRAVMIPVALMPQSSSVALQHQTHTLHTMCPLCNINALMSDSRLRAVFFFFCHGHTWPSKLYVFFMKWVDTVSGPHSPPPADVWGSFLAHTGCHASPRWVLQIDRGQKDALSTVKPF